MYISQESSKNPSYGEQDFLPPRFLLHIVSNDLHVIVSINTLSYLYKHILDIT